MIYEVLPPTNVVEASVTLEPDDISRAAVKIQVTGSASDGLKWIDFEVPTPDTAPATEFLTRNPASITPVATQFANWSFVHKGKGVFRATPQGGRVATPATFVLHDVEIAEGEGVTTIGIVERLNDQDVKQDTSKASVRKGIPTQRVDTFTVKPVVIDLANNPPATILLSWATTATSSVTLTGPAGEKISVGDKDSSVTVPRPRTTGVYTLQAGDITQQVAVIVKGQVDVLDTPLKISESITKTEAGTTTTSFASVSMFRKSGSLKVSIEEAGTTTEAASLGLDAKNRPVLQLLSALRFKESAGTPDAEAFLIASSSGRLDFQARPTDPTVKPALSIARVFFGQDRQAEVTVNGQMRISGPLFLDLNGQNALTLENSGSSVPQLTVAGDVISNRVIASELATEVLANLGSRLVLGKDNITISLPSSRVPDRERVELTLTAGGELKLTGPNINRVVHTVILGSLL